MDRNVDVVTPDDRSSRPRVVVIDDDAGTLSMFVRILQLEGFFAQAAASAREGIDLCREVRPQVVLVDLRLPEMSGIEVLRELEPSRQRAEFIVISGFADVESTVAAVKLGAADVVEKPISPERLVSIVRESIARTSADGHLSTPVPHALRRWAEVVVKVVDSPDDVRTLGEWGHFVGASRGALRNWCRTARLSSKRSLAVARMLRAVVRGQRCGASPENLLNVVDRRTLAKLLGASGCRSCQAKRLPTVDDFLERQRFITDSGAIAELAIALRRSRERLELTQ